MNIKLISIKLWRHSLICLFLLFVFVLGTFFPNDYIKKTIRQKTLDEIKNLVLFEPKIEIISSDRFIESMKKCIAYHNLEIKNQEQIPSSLIIAQAIMESNFGKSRFAIEGNNLFGIRVWSKNGILPLAQDPSINWRVKIFKTKCQSVKFYIDLLNTNHHYQEFRITRNKTKDPILLANTLDNFSTSKEYSNYVKKILIKYKDKL
jgi:Bax protein